MDTLPEELLQNILTLVPVSSLLPLRVLCRRLRRSVLDRAVWKHRQLIGTRERAESNRLSYVNTGLLRTILRLAPAVDRVSLNLQAGRSAGVAAAQAMGRGTCQVRRLELHLYFGPLPSGMSLSRSCRTAINSIFQGQKQFLRELSLRIIVSTGSTFDAAVQPWKNALQEIFTGIRDLQVIKTLELCVSVDNPSVSVGDYPSDGSLPSLSELQFWGRSCCSRSDPSANTIRSLISAAKDSLLVLRADRNISAIADALPDCKVLRELHIGAYEITNWQFLRNCAALELLSVKAWRGHGLASLQRLLDMDTPREVRVTLSNFNTTSLPLLITALRKARHLSLQYFGYQSQSKLLRLLRSLTELTDLHLDDLHMYPQQAPVDDLYLSGWTEDVVPNLRRLTVALSSSDRRKGDWTTLLDQLQSRRPQLEISIVEPGLIDLDEF